jgi:hypothetical protein
LELAAWLSSTTTSGLDVRLDPAQQARLAEVSAIELGFPHGALRRLDLAR